jgi:hypothetical protein
LLVLAGRVLLGTICPDDDGFAMVVVNLVEVVIDGVGKERLPVVTSSNPILGLSLARVATLSHTRDPESSTAFRKGLREILCFSK